MSRTSSRAPQTWRKNLQLAAILTLLVLTLAISSPAQTFTSLASFDGTNGYGPGAAMVQALDGNLYGTAGSGGRLNGGTIFKFAPAGTITLLQNFCTRTNGCGTGTVPTGSLVLSSNGDFFGTAGGGGQYSTGTVFEATTWGMFHLVYSFCALSNCTDGDNPYGLIQATDGKFYGTAYNGGANDYGDVFKITAEGQLTTLYSFCSLSSCADGEAPGASLLQAANGNFYGTTNYGGANSSGTIFELTPSGTLTTLYSFCSQPNCADGNFASKLVQGAKGDFYGTTSEGGANNAGTIFKLTSSGTFITLYSFCSQANCADGGSSNAELIQANDGNLYGTASSGGAYNVGTLFKITVDGAFTKLHDFNTTDGAYPVAALLQATDGKLYGTTAGGGSLGITCTTAFPGCGTVFSLSSGLTPFVRTLKPWAHVGWSVVIYGSDLTGTTSVKFNGTPATFTVVSPTEIETTVPAGATSGKIQVVTPGGTLSTNAEFHVRS
jgi:uncharacterized repeat protein (TIGR03803 family)